MRPSKTSFNKKRKTYWTDKTRSYQFLSDQFDLFLKTDGAKGIDPTITERKKINDIFEKFSVFSKEDISQKQFPDNFKKLASDKALGRHKDRKRENAPSKLFYFIVLYSWFATNSFLIVAV